MSLESVVYRLVAEPKTPLVIEIVISLSISKDHLRLCALLRTRSSIAAGNVGEGVQFAPSAVALRVVSAKYHPRFTAALR